MNNQIVIQKNKKTKVIALFVLIILGISITYAIAEYLLPALPGFMRFKITVLASIGGLFTFAIILILTQILSNKPAIIIDREGVTDYSSPSSIGLIPWADIVDVREATNSMKQKLVVLDVENPQAYINKKARFKDVRQNFFKQFGSPIIIMLVNLKGQKESFAQSIKEQLVNAAGK